MQTWEKIKIVGGTYIQQPRNNITLSGNFINLKQKFLEIHDVRKLYLWKDGWLQFWWKRTGESNGW